VSYEDDREFRRNLRGPEYHELADVLEYRRVTGAVFRPDEIDEVSVGAPNQATALEALRPILAAGRISRFRLLAVVCRTDHLLAQVIRTARGPVVTGRAPYSRIEIEHLGGDSIPAQDGDGWVDGAWQYNWQRTRQISRMLSVCVFLDALSDIVEPRTGLGVTENGGTSVTNRAIGLQCRCSRVSIVGSWLAAHIEAGRRRVVFAK